MELILNGRHSSKSGLELTNRATPGSDATLDPVWNKLPGIKNLGELIRSIKIKSGNVEYDAAVKVAVWQVRRTIRSLNEEIDKLAVHKRREKVLRRIERDAALLQRDVRLAKKALNKQPASSRIKGAPRLASALASALDLSKRLQSAVESDSGR
ncbi:MAG TPA: hypothetical protein VGY56_21325 [Verrucomicrobiae bacterium]|nr:hypothetical protein [Verrucomicrobiae bacterium]